MRLQLRSSRNIWIMSMIIFTAVVVSMLFSTYYMNLSIQQEENAQTTRAEYKQLGENLANASDYLTEEVRYFAITGDVKHLYNYWNEIFNTRQRENAIAKFESSSPPNNEMKLLEQAKKYSDLLVETEIYSMKMVLVSMDKTPDDYAYDDQLKQYIDYVLSYSNPAEMNGMTKEEMRDKAIEILYDENYEDYKTKIMTPIEDFKKLMNQRLDKEVEERKQGTKIATIVQIVLAAASLTAIGFLLIIMNHLYIKPLKSYTKEIYAAGDYTDGMHPVSEDVQILRAKIVPYGAMELIRFAEAFNQMIDMFFVELRNRKNAEESMRKARNEAEYANAAKSIFLAQMSHELRTPLNAVNGYTYLLEQTNMEGKQMEYLKNIRYSSNGLLELINQILDFSKIESGHLELECVDFNLREMVNEVHAIFAQQAQAKNLSIHTIVEEQIPHVVKGDPLRMRQVLINLIGNAIKFTETGGITVDIRLAEQKEEVCRIHFSIKDTGIGVDDEVKEKIFQPFTQSDASVTRRYGGTGLGLPICSKIIAMSGDRTHRLQLESELHKGSNFYFDMDFLISKKRAEELETKKMYIPDCHGKKVLITDDSEINIRVQSEILALCGITVVAAEHGKKAIQILKEQLDIDLILMDIRMPEMDGYETTRYIRRMDRYKKTPVIALTADAVPEVRLKIKEAGMNDCLLKPISQDQLFIMLEKCFSLAVHPDQIEQKRKETKKYENTQDKKAVSQDGTYFDETACLEQLNGNKVALMGIIHRFLVLHKNDDKKLDTLLAAQDYEQAEECVHMLKGIAGNLHCYLLEHCCKVLQNELKEKKPEGVTEFRRIWELTVSALKEVQKNRLPEDDARDTSKNPLIMQKELLDLCETIHRLSLEYDTEAIVLLEKYIDKIEFYYGSEMYHQLQDAAMKYDFKNICELTKRIMLSEKKRR